jgi:hypothetical protein
MVTFSTPVTNSKSKESSGHIYHMDNILEDTHETYILGILATCI